MSSSVFTQKQWMICAIVLMAIGIVFGVAGCVVAAVGFGLQPKDMFDYKNLGMRIAGLVMIGFSILPLAISVCCWVFYCAEKRDAKKVPTSSKAYVVKTHEPMEMAQYPYSDNSRTDTRIYKPQQQPVSAAGRYSNVDADDSSAPLTFSSSMSPRDVSGAVPGSSFEDSDPSSSKARKPKKGRKGGRQGEAAADEAESMMYGGQSTATSSSYRSDVKA